VVRCKYKIINSQGIPEEGDVDFSSKQALRDYIEQQGSLVLSIDCLDQSNSHGRWLARNLDVDWSRLTADWAALLESGLPISDSLHTLAEWQLSYTQPSKRRLGVHIEGVLNALKQGQSLDQAWLSSGLNLPASWLLSLRLGQQTAKLAEVLRHWLALQEWQSDFKGRLKKLLTYPVIALSLLLLVVGFMLIWVLPDLIGFLIDMGAPINNATRSMYLLSNLLLDYPVAFLLGSLITTLLIYGLVKVIGLAKMPYLGRVSLALKRAYLMRQFNWLLLSGATLHDTVTQMAKNTVDLKQRKQLEELFQQLEQGKKMPDAIVTCLDLPDFCLKLFKLAEKTGQLTEVTRQLADYFEAQAKQQLDQIEPWIEPVTTLVLGAIVIWMILAILGPVYGMMANAVF